MDPQELFFQHLEELAERHGVELDDENIQEIIDAQGATISPHGTEAVFREMLPDDVPWMDRPAPEPPEQWEEEPDAWEEADDGDGDFEEENPDLAADVQYLHKELGRTLTDNEADRLYMEAERQRRNGFQDLADAATDAGIKPLTEMSSDEHRAFAKERLAEMDETSRPASFEIDPDESRESMGAWARARYQELNNGDT